MAHVSLAVLLPWPVMAQTTPGALSGPLELRGARAFDPRDLTVDPRFVPADAAQGLRSPGPMAGPVAPLPGMNPDQPQGMRGGATQKRRTTRASRIVQQPVAGGAQMRVRTELPSVTTIPVPQSAGPEPIPLRRMQTTRITTPAPNALRDYPARRPSRPEEDAWAALGLRMGTFVVSPSITQSAGFDTNPNRAPNGRGSAVSRTEGELTIRSDWSTHAFSANLRGGYSYFASQRDASRPDGTGTANLRLNLSRDTDIDMDLRSSLETQRPGSTNLGANVTERPLVYGYGASVGVTQRFNRLSVNLRGSVDRATYNDARDTTGALVRQSDRNANQYGVRARAGYELLPGVTPFVEVSTDSRLFDERADSNGFRRGSTGAGARVGSSFALTRALTGEVSAGYQMRDYQDPRLTDLRGLVGDAALIWTASPLTTVTLRATTDLADTTIPNVSGSINRRASVEVAHALRRNWTVTGFANLSRNEFDGISLTENTWQMGLRTEYRLTRTVAVRASFTHERLNSTTPGADYTANVFLVGLRLQL